MNTKTRSATRDLVLAALFLALAFVLPMITGHVPQIGNMLCPMHFPVLLAGFVLGGPWGLALGFAAPLLRSVLFGMPPMYPIAIAMAFELATYGLVSGLLWRRAKHSLPALYAVLLTAMVSGRIVWGIVRFVLAGLTGGSFPFSAFLSGALFTAVPGIVAQLVLIPLLLLIYILFCLIASRKPSGRATLSDFLRWSLTIVATGGVSLREYGGEQRHRLDELFDEARDELRDREIDRMQEWVAADTVSVIATEPAPQTAPASDSAHRITIKGPKKQKVDIRVTEHSVDIDFDDESYE